MVPERIFKSAFIGLALGACGSEPSAGTGGAGVNGSGGSGGIAAGASSAGAAPEQPSARAGAASGGPPAAGAPGAAAGTGQGGADYGNPGSGGTADATDAGGSGLGAGASAGGAMTGGAASATAGAAGNASANSACPAGSFLCEGFESYAANAAPSGIWTKTERGAGRIEVDSTRQSSGVKALHVTGVINTDVAHITTPVSVSGSLVFVRFMMYTVGYPSSSGVHSRLARIGTTADSGPDSAYSLSSYNGTAIEKVDSIYLRSTATKLNDDQNKNRWLCIEFEIDETGGVGKVVPHLWLDSTALTLAAAGSSTHAGTSTSWDPISFQKFTIGLEGNQPDAVAGNYWIDDLIIAPQRVGCPGK